jgi:hypothetical protein
MIRTLGWQLFRRGHPLLCTEMKFAPIGESNKPSFTDSRSLLRVPSLASSNGSAVVRSKIATDQIDGSSVSKTDKQDVLVRSLSSARNVVDYTGSPLCQHSACYVNYSPEELNLTANGWKLSSGSNTHGSWTGLYSAGATQTTVYEREQNAPPYSPLRIRSTRGSRRSNSSLRPNPSHESTMSRSRGFPISNRGKGLRTFVANSVANRNYDSYSEGEIAMLSDVNTALASTPDQSPSKNTDVHLRSVFKRKLPMAATSEASG